jgi:hypothetical protein
VLGRRSVSQAVAGSTTHLHASPQPIAPLPLPPATVPAAQLLARLFPDADDEARQASLDNTIRSEGSREAGLALLQRAYNMFNTCPVEGVHTTLPLLQRTMLMVHCRPPSLPLALLSGTLILARTPYFITRLTLPRCKRTVHLPGPFTLAVLDKDGVRL